MSESDGLSKGATILIIEDDDTTAANLQTGLIGAGYVVQRVGSANEALATLESSETHLILMNLLLPGTDGLTLCSTLATEFGAPPIIVLSPRPGEVDRALALQSGAFALLTTPVDVDELLTHVQAAVRAPVSVQS